MPRYESALMEFCNTIMGSPEYGRSWFCPFCDPDPDREHRNDQGKKKPWASFSVRPPMRKPGTKNQWYPIKFRCHRCKVFGDEHDLLNLFFHDDPEYRQWWIDYFRQMYPPELRSPRHTSLRPSDKRVSGPHDQAREDDISRGKPKSSRKGIHEDRRGMADISGLDRPGDNGHHKKHRH